MSVCVGSYDATHDAQLLWSDKLIGGGRVNAARQPGLRNQSPSRNATPKDYLGMPSPSVSAAAAAAAAGIEWYRELLPALPAVDYLLTYLLNVSSNVPDHPSAHYLLDWTGLPLPLDEVYCILGRVFRTIYNS